MTTKSLLQLPIINTLTQEVRQGFKGIAGDNDEKTQATIAKSTRKVVKVFSKLKVDKHQVTGADSATIDRAVKWGDRVARPFELGVKYGATTANAWDYAFSFLVGRGVKGLDEPADFRKLSGDKQTRSAQKANNWAAMRQEGLLGLLTRIPAGALGSLVGRCFDDTKRGQDVQAQITNATIGFNAAVRAATLTVTASAIMITGVLVGTGVSALAALVAVPTLMRLKVGDAAPASPATTEQTASAQKGRSEEVTSAAGAGDNAPSPWHELEAFHASALKNLEAVHKATANGKKSHELKKQVQAAKHDVEKLLAAETPDRVALSKAYAKLSKAEMALDNHHERTHHTKAEGHSLEKASQEAQKAFAEAKTQHGGDTPEVRQAFQVWDDAVTALADHKDRAGVDAKNASKISKSASKKLMTALTSYQKHAFALASIAGQNFLDGKSSMPDMSDMQDRHREVTSTWEQLHASGALDGANMPLDHVLETMLHDATKVASASLSKAEKGAAHLAQKFSENKTHIQMLQEDLAKQRIETSRLNAQTADLSPSNPSFSDTAAAAQKSMDRTKMIAHALRTLQVHAANEVGERAVIAAAHQEAGRSLAKIVGNALLKPEAETEMITKLLERYLNIQQILDDLDA